MHQNHKTEQTGLRQEKRTKTQTTVTQTTLNKT